MSSKPTYKIGGPYGLNNNQVKGKETKNSTQKVSMRQASRHHNQPKKNLPNQGSLNQIHKVTKKPYNCTQSLNFSIEKQPINSQAKKSQQNGQMAIMQYQKSLIQFIESPLSRQMNEIHKFKIDSQIQQMIRALKNETNDFRRNMNQFLEQKDFINIPEHSSFYKLISILNERKSIMDILFQKKSNVSQYLTFPITPQGNEAIKVLKQLKNNPIEKTMRSDLAMIMQKQQKSQGKFVKEVYINKNIEELSILQVYQNIKNKIGNKSLKQQNFQNQRQYLMKISVLENKLKYYEDEDCNDKKNERNHNEQARSNYFKDQFTKQQNKNKALEEDIAKFKQEVAALKMQCRLLTDENTRLKQSKDKLLQQCTKQKQQSQSLKLATKMSVQQHQSRINFLQKSLEQFVNENKRYKQQINQLNVQVQRQQQLKDELDTEKYKVNQLLVKVKRLQADWHLYSQRSHEVESKYKEMLKNRQQFDKLRQEHQKCQRQSIAQQSIIIQLQTKQKQYNDNLKQKQNQINELKTRFVGKGNSVEKLSQQNRKLERDVQQYKSKIKEFQQSIVAKANQITQMSNRLKQLYPQLVAQKKIKSDLQERVKVLQINIRQVNDQKSRVERNLKAKIQEYEDLKNNNDMLSQMLDQRSDLKCDASFSEPNQTETSTKIKQLEEKVQTMIKKEKEDQLKINRLESQLSNEKGNKELVNTLKNTITSLEFQNQELLRQTPQSKQSKIVKSNVGFSRFITFFQHQLLEDFHQYKQYLAETIEERYNLRIRKTKMIYCFDPINKVNFHQYFDSIPHIVLIVKTTNGMFMAAYSEGPFVPKKISDKDGMIISLTFKKYFTPCEFNKRAITYDEYYIIFGNSQVRIKSQDNKLFSNFAITNGYYNSKGQKVSVLLGGGPTQREVVIESYQIYQVFFEAY